MLPSRRRPPATNHRHHTRRRPRHIIQPRRNQHRPIVTNRPALRHRHIPQRVRRPPIVDARRRPEHQVPGRAALHRIPVRLDDRRAGHRLRATRPEQHITHSSRSSGRAHRRSGRACRYSYSSSGADGGHPKRGNSRSRGLREPHAGYSTPTGLVADPARAARIGGSVTCTSRRRHPLTSPTVRPDRVAIPMRRSQVTKRMIRNQHPRLTLDVIQRRSVVPLVVSVSVDRVTTQLAHPPIPLIDCTSVARRNREPPTQPTSLSLRGRLPTLPRAIPGRRLVRDREMSPTPSARTRYERPPARHRRANPRRPRRARCNHQICRLH